MLVLRWKYHGERGWKVPPNIRIGKTEIPIGLFSVFLVLLSTAIVNLSRNQSPRSAASSLPRPSSSSSRSRSGTIRRRHALTTRQMKEHFQLEHQDTVGREALDIRPGAVMVTMRDCRQPLRAEMGAGSHQDGRSGCGGAHRAHDGRRRPGIRRMPPSSSSASTSRCSLPRLSLSRRASENISPCWSFRRAISSPRWCRPRTRSKLPR